MMQGTQRNNLNLFGLILSLPSNRPTIRYSLQDGL